MQHNDSKQENGAELQFKRYLDEGRFMLQRAASGRHYFYPRIAEPGTGDELEWVEANGWGTVYSATVVRQRPPQKDYSVVLVDLDEGPRMMSTVEGLLPQAIKIGLRVCAKIVALDGCNAIVFVPAEGPSNEQ